MFRTTSLLLSVGRGGGKRYRHDLPSCVHGFHPEISYRRVKTIPESNKQETMMKRGSKKQQAPSRLLREKTNSKKMELNFGKRNSRLTVKSPQRPSVKSLVSGTCLIGGRGSSSTLLASGTMNESRSSVVTMTTKSNSFSSARSPPQAENETSSIVLVFDESIDDEKPEEDAPSLTLHYESEQYKGCIPTFVTASASPTSATRLLSAAFPDSMAIPIQDTTRIDSEKIKEEHAYWTTILTDRTKQYGSVHTQTARACFSLGQSYLRSNDYPQAMAAFLEAHKIYNSIHGPNHLSIAQALDSYGLACMKFRKYERAEKALQCAFRIRFHNLGVWHVDTVETFNKIASVHLHMGNLEKALEEFKEVFKVRRAIFGSQHPAVAITAHALANVHANLGQTSESNTFFALAQRIYKQMGLSHDHQTVAELLSDQIKHSTPKEDTGRTHFFNFFR
jgi:tetratricopeptide (TPR) repeat protein